MAPKAPARAAPKQRKSTPTKHVKAEGNKYKYTELAKASLTSGDEQNFYAMVIDATFPYKTNKDYYICSMKIVDPSLHMKSAKGSGDNSEYATLVFFAKKFEDLPIIHRIGDIIRVHRAALRIYNHQRQFNVNIYYKGSWCLFSTDKRSPIQEVNNEVAGSDKDAFGHSGKNYSFEKHDASLLSNIRKWSNDYLNKFNAISADMYTPLSKAASQKKDFDVVAKILQVFEMDDYTNELKLRDSSNQVFYCLALKLKFPHLKQGDAVRVRSCAHDNTSTSKNMLLLSHFSNIMTFCSSSKLAREVRAVKDSRSDEQSSLKSGDSSHCVVLTEVDKKHANLPTHSINDLFHFADSDPEISKQSTFRTKFYVTKVESADCKEWTKSYDKKTKKFSSMKGSTTKSGVW